MKKDENCVFCKIIDKQIPAYSVYEDDNLFGFLDIHPIKKGHMLLVPKHHTEDVTHMEESEYNNLFHTGKILATKIKNILDVPRVGMVIEGFGVNHAHLHLIPVTGGNQLNPELAYKASKEELEEVKNIYKF